MKRILLLVFGFLTWPQVMQAQHDPFSFNPQTWNDLKQISTPASNPSSGNLRFYAKTGGSLICVKNNLGAETCFGAGSVTSVGLAGTANQITVTGSSPVTGSGSWTLSIPNPFTLPGKANMAASTTGMAAFNVAAGLAPTAPVTGDFWQLTGTLQFYDGSHTNTFPMVQTLPPTSGHLAVWAGGEWGVLLGDGGTDVANVPLLNAANTFNLLQTFSAGAAISGSGGTTFNSDPILAPAIALEDQIANDTSTGTFLNKLASLTGAPSTAIVTTAGATSGVKGIVASGAGKSGSAGLARGGQASCVFENATVAGHYVGPGATWDGDCRDTGATYPTSGQFKGTVLATTAVLAVPAATTGADVNAVGTMAAGTYYACTTYVSAGGETTCSASNVQWTETLNHQVTVPSPGALTNATGYRVYVTAANGGDGTQTLQLVTGGRCTAASGALPVTSGAQIGACAIGSAWTSTSVQVGAAVPGANTAGIAANMLPAGPEIDLPARQGTDTNLLTSGTVSNSSGVTLCTDANHGATTTGCTSSLDQLTGSAAQATGTETLAGHQYTFAGIETANLTYPFVFTDANSAGNNTSGALIIQTTGTSTAAVPLLINEATQAGNFVNFIKGGTVTNGVESGGTSEFSVSALGAVTALLSVVVGTAPTWTAGTGGSQAFTEGTAATGAANVDGTYANSANHCLSVNNNNADVGCAAAFNEVNLFAPTARSTTDAVLPYFKITEPTDLNATLSTEGNGVLLATGTRQWAVGTVPIQREVFLQGPTYAGVGATATFTDAATLGVTPPLVGANAAITRNHSILVVDSTSAGSAVTGALVVATTPGTTAGSVGIGGGQVFVGTEVYAPIVGSPAHRGSSTNSSGSFQAGVDATTDGTTAVATFRGEDVTGGSTASIAGGATTIRGGDNASSGATETAGAITLRGGDDTNASASVNVAGAVTIRGGNTASSSTSGTAGSVVIQPGSCTAAEVSAACNGTVKFLQAFFTTGTATVHSLACVTATNTVATCSSAANGANAIGWIDSVSSNTVYVQMGTFGQVVTGVALSATFTAGQWACADVVTTAGDVIPSATKCAAGLPGGVVLTTATTTAPVFIVSQTL
jgi:hypothetical protein